jgi:hypothetical protein
MIPEFNGNGNLPAGFITPKLEEFEEHFVANFQDSTTRREIFNGYIRYTGKLDAIKVATIQWVNGSYTTSKVNPTDIDFVAHIDAIELDRSGEIKEPFAKLTDKSRAKSECRCDVYFIAVYPPEIPELYESTKEDIEYWSKWFAHDRENNPKGIIEFNLSDGSFNIEKYYGGVIDG